MNDVYISNVYIINQKNMLKNSATFCCIAEGYKKHNYQKKNVRIRDAINFHNRCAK